MPNQIKLNEIEQRFRNYNSKFHFTVVSQYLARDSRLSWKARGLFLYLASNNHKWNFHLSEVSKHSKKDGRVSTRSALNELIHYKYLKRVQPHQNGRFQAVKWTLYYVPSDCHVSNNTAGRKPVSSNSANSSNVSSHATSNKNQPKQLKSSTSINRPYSRTSSHKYQESGETSRDERPNVRTMALNIFEEIFHHSFNITGKTKIYLNNWIDQIKYRARNEHDINIGIQHLKYSMIYARNGVKSTSPNAIAEYINSCFMDPVTTKSTSINYSAFIDFGKDNRANCDEILIDMHERFNTNIASFINQRNVFKLIQKYGASKVNKAVKYTDHHAVNKVRSENDWNITGDVIKHPVKYIKETLTGDAW